MTPVGRLPFLRQSVGHEFVANIRDSSIWSGVKERIKGLPGVAIAVVAELAKAEIKKETRIP